RRWSLSSRKNGLAAEKLKEKQARNAGFLEAFAESYLKAHPDIRFFMFGHLHILLDKKLSSAEARLLIIGDWMQLFSYAEWDGDRLELKTFL
ncbi:MAG: UDP-2,3-diacylglucosamine diphosphatase, partial [Tannerella sp.]|nr:UDP-2,3-diacylglucosamine diphosphatase [Tannerella sp.]